MDCRSVFFTVVALPIEWVNLINESEMATCLTAMSKFQFM